jgi:hypothetical protein
MTLRTQVAPWRTYVATLADAQTLPHNARMTATTISPRNVSARLAEILADPMTPPRHAVNGRSITCATQTTQTPTPELGTTGAATLERAGESHH